MLSEGMITRLAEKSNLVVITKALETYEKDKTYILFESDGSYAIESVDGQWYNEDKDEFGSEESRTVYTSLAYVPFVTAGYEQRISTENEGSSDVRFFEGEESTEPYAVLKNLNPQGI